MIRSTGSVEEDYGNHHVHRRRSNRRVSCALVPGKDAMGILPTILLGIVGSFVGGLLAVVFTDREFNEFSAAGLIGSIIGAIVALLIYRQVRGRV